MKLKKPSKVSQTKGKLKNNQQKKGLLLRNASEVLTLVGAAQKKARFITEADLSIEKNQSLFVQEGRILWIGPDRKIPKSFAVSSNEERPCKGATLAPGLVECHTHLLFAGDRSHEFEMRNRGVSYQEIARQGGGILSTMHKTRQASVKQLLLLGQQRVRRFLKQGVTTLEVKSGYALDCKNELKMLEAVNQLKGLRALATYLGPHAKPPEFVTASDYMDYIIADILPLLKAKKLARRCDIFVESGFFELSEARRYFAEVKKLGFELVVHAEQLTRAGGAALAVDFGAVSVDHLLQINSDDIEKLAASETTCVLLPSSDLYMKTVYPPARLLIDRGARVALATDFNPGSSPSQDVSLVGLLARLEMKMTLPEVIAAYTLGAAYALHLEHEVGSLEVGKSADFFLSPNSWTHFFYEVGNFPIKATFYRGQCMFESEE